MAATLFMENDMSNISKANKLQEAINKLHEADALLQQALGATDECYEMHNAIEDIADELQEYAEQLVEMQVTD
jgi:uncharacterized coiled-coil DUF342 family protein